MRRKFSHRTSDSITDVYATFVHVSLSFIPEGHAFYTSFKEYGQKRKSRLQKLIKAIRLLHINLVLEISDVKRLLGNDPIAQPGKQNCSAKSSSLPFRDSDH